MKTITEVIVAYTNMLHMVEERLETKSGDMTKEEKAAYLQTRDMLHYFLWDLANIESIK